jgi:type I restriction enzyme R subunit
VLTPEDKGLKPIGTGTSTGAEEDYDFLSNIIKVLNETYGVNLTDEDRLDIAAMRTKVQAHQELIAVRNSDNTEANVRYKFDKVLDEILLEFVNTKLDLYKKLSETNINVFLKQRWFEEFYGTKGV